MELGIDVEIQLVVTLSRLSIGNTLRMYREIYGLAKPTTFIIIRNCCEAIKILLKPVIFQKLTKSRIETISREFEEIRGIPYIIDVVDGSLL